MRGLRFSILIFGLILLSVIISGCNSSNKVDIENKTISAFALIKNHEEINSVEIEKKQTDKPDKIINDITWIKELIKDLESIEVMKLSQDQDKDFMEDGKKMLKEDLRVVRLLDKEKNPCGMFLIWNTGQIYVIDIESMSGSNRTVAFLSKKKHPAIYDRL